MSKPHEKWCATMPREFDLPLGRKPSTRCDCGAAQPEAGEHYEMDKCAIKDREMRAPVKHNAVGFAPVIEPLSAEQWGDDFLMMEREGGLKQKELIAKYRLDCRLGQSILASMFRAYALQVRQEAERDVLDFLQRDYGANDVVHFASMYDDLKDDIARLTAAGDALTKQVASEHIVAANEMESCERAEAALLKYGRHLDGCTFDRANQVCGCGFGEVLKEKQV